MKLKYDFVIREVAGHLVAITVGAPQAEFNGIVHLKKGGAYLFEKLREETTEEALAADLVATQGLSPERAADVVSRFCDRLRKNRLLTE